MRERIHCLLAASLVCLSSLSQTGGSSLADLVRKTYNSPAQTRVLRVLDAVSAGTPGAPYNVCVSLNGDPCSQMGVAWFTDGTAGTTADATTATAGTLEIVAKAGATTADFASSTTGYKSIAATVETASLPYSQTKNKL